MPVLPSVTQQANDDALIGPRLTLDVFCVHCGYNLRGLRPEDSCPECGNLVGKSLRGESLRFAPRHWLRKLHRGFFLLELSFATLLFVPMPFIFFLLWEIDATDGDPVYSLRLAWVVAVGLALAALIALPGLLMVTASPPSLVRQERGSVSSTITRGTACLLALSTASLLVAWAPTFSGNLAFASLRAALGCIIPLLFAVLGLSYTWFTAAMLHRGVLARSSPNRVAFWLFALFLVCSACYGVSLAVLVLTDRLGVLVGVLFLAELGLGLLSVAALFVMTRRIRRLLGRLLRAS